MSERTILIYEVKIDTAYSEEGVQTVARLALASLFHTTANALEKNISHGSVFGKKNRITLILETDDRLSGKYVLKIERVDNE